jgi:ASC-1-like (ASCH) protein
MKDEVILNLQERYFHAIGRGLKKIEGRLGKEKYLHMQPGSNICFNMVPSLPMGASGEHLPSIKMQESKKHTLHCKVVRVVKYASFRDMLECEGLSIILPDVKSIELGVAIYREFYSIEDESLYGAVAIHISRAVSF